MGYRYSNTISQVSRRAKFTIGNSLPSHIHGNSENTFFFLNSSLSFDPDNINWNPQNKSRLWKYNLHYFDYLRDSSYSLEAKYNFIDSWIRECTQPMEVAWEPYPCSLRVVNWILFFSQIDPDDIKNEWLKSLYMQSLFIEKNLEKDILANHYFENIKSLLFAGVYFKSTDSRRWISCGQKALNEQLDEQFLNDGGHYERSMLYHNIMIENCLDLYNLFANNIQILDADILNKLQFQCTKSLMWLYFIMYKNGEIPLFNDSANGIAKSYDQLSSYANSLYGYFIDEESQSSRKLIDLQDSGYYGYEYADDKFIIDCGSIGPNYQPGHAHCDYLSYELMLGGQLIVVDTGIYEYKEDDLRSYVRSTKAHNTITVDDEDQSEMWSAFRVARRAKSLTSEIIDKSTSVVFNGAYEGFPRIRGKVKHNRHLNLSLTENNIKIIYIKDIIHFNGSHEVKNYIHLHPHIICEKKNENQILLNLENKHIATITINKGCEYLIASSYYCPEFGKKMSTFRIDNF